jgi:protease-4
MTEVQNVGKPRKRFGCLMITLFALGVYFLMSAIFGGIMSMLLVTPPTIIEDNTVYRIDMAGEVVEQSAEENPFDALMEELSGMESVSKVGLNDLLNNIELAKNNDKILGIYLRGGELSIAPASAKALRAALMDFKASGKFVIAYADAYTQTNYYIASVADKVYLNPVGTIAWDGLTAQKMYFTRLFEKLFGYKGKATDLDKFISDL